MKSRTRKQHEMGKRALGFSRAHPDSTAGGDAALAKLDALVTESDQLSLTEAQGRLEAHSATEQKRQLRRKIRRSLLPHLAGAAKLASREVPGLTEKFVIPRNTTTYVGFLTAARAMQAEAVSNKDLLVKYGVSDTVLQALDQSLTDLATTIDAGALSRQAHIGANDKLASVGGDIVQVVKVLNALNQLRFAEDPQLLGEWESASNVVAMPKSAPKETPAPAPAPSSTPAATPPATQQQQGGEVRPAA